MWNTDSSKVFDIWPEAADLPPAAYQTIMQSANALCAAYAPPVDPWLAPDNYKLAEILQARHIWSQNGRGNSDNFGPDGLQISTYSLVMTARDLLRPKSSPLRRIR